MTVATTERPILFSGAMVRAILDGSKTQTRRIIKEINGGKGDSLDMRGPLGPLDGLNGDGKLDVEVQTAVYDVTVLLFDCPYEVGMRLWVRECFGTIDDGLENDGDSRAICYRATGTAQWRDMPHAKEKRANGIHAYYTEPARWRPSIHMPRWASRITLEVTGVRVERLNDISEADAQAEGVERIELGPYIQAFTKLWESINGADSWAANPWVWVIEFKVI